MSAMVVLVLAVYSTSSTAGCSASIGCEHSNAMLASTTVKHTPAFTSDPGGHCLLIARQHSHGTGCFGCNGDPGRVQASINHSEVEATVEDRSNLETTTELSD